MGEKLKLIEKQNAKKADELSKIKNIEKDKNEKELKSLKTRNNNLEEQNKKLQITIDDYSNKINQIKEYRKSLFLLFPNH